MASTAEQRGRNKKIARGMVDEELSFTFSFESRLYTCRRYRRQKRRETYFSNHRPSLKIQIADGTAENINSVLDS